MIQRRIIVEFKRDKEKNDHGGEWGGMVCVVWRNVNMKASMFAISLEKCRVKTMSEGIQVTEMSMMNLSKTNSAVYMKGVMRNLYRKDMPKVMPRRHCIHNWLTVYSQISSACLTNYISTSSGTEGVYMCLLFPW